MIRLEVENSVKQKLMAALMVGLVVGGATVASAEPGGPMQGDHGRGHQNHGRNMGPGDRGPGGPGGPGRGNDGRGGMPGPDGGRVWHRGDRYDGPRGGMWAVQDWRQYRGLSAPPPGYYWVQYGNQFLLTAVATGIISSVIAGTYAAGPGGY